MKSRQGKKVMNKFYAYLTDRDARPRMTAADWAYLRQNPVKELAVRIRVMLDRNPGRAGTVVLRVEAPA